MCSVSQISFFFFFQSEDVCSIIHVYPKVIDIKTEFMIWLPVELEDFSLLEKEVEDLSIMG